LFQPLGDGDDAATVGTTQVETSVVEDTVEGQTPRRKMPKQMRRLDEPRCEGVGFNAFEHLFCKRYFGQFEAPHISCNGTSFFVNILRDINVSFVTSVYIDCLGFIEG
jgi:hypothetical protein